MFRFTIRDGLWLTVVLAMVLGWWLWNQKLKQREFDLLSAAVIIEMLIRDLDQHDPEWRKSRPYITPQFESQLRAASERLDKLGQ